ncbi:MAG TPA: type IV toxin-antitoxin system AbiEi family antitoxin [Terrimesophilobacter sp.]|nr:type IV toxin-antitoxin system AbiEi family antitoxin [Terrimesophilobacter sp.]
MSFRLPAVLSRSDLPEAELCAARLDGEVYGIDECFSPIDEVERPLTRANALASITPARFIAEQRTAAWVHGALAFPPAVHQFCVAARARAKPSHGSRMTVREVEIDDREIQSFGGIRVTTPLRTVVDLARFSRHFGSNEESIVTALLTIDDFGIDECRLALNLRHNLPRKRLALRRISVALSRR